ncbi:ribonuclease G [Providencia stuartii]|uniref:ribonuclease G n=1 Tax=Providencia stuartii TaxID=588 RepID=UPI0034DD3F98
MSYENKSVPNEIKRWNWGAFIFNIYWGIGNKSYFPLLTLIPLLNIVWIFVCGIKGNEWAWKNGDYDSVETFMKVQETWNRAGLFCFIISIVVTFIMFFFLSSIIAIFGAASMQGHY